MKMKNEVGKKRKLGSGMLPTGGLSGKLAPLEPNKYVELVTKRSEKAMKTWSRSRWLVYEDFSSLKQVYMSRLEGIVTISIHPGEY